MLFFGLHPMLLYWDRQALVNYTATLTWAFNGLAELSGCRVSTEEFHSVEERCQAVEVFGLHGGGQCRGGSGSDPPMLLATLVRVWASVKTCSVQSRSSQGEDLLVFRMFHYYYSSDASLSSILTPWTYGKSPENFQIAEPRWKILYSKAK